MSRLSRATQAVVRAKDTRKGKQHTQDEPVNSSSASSTVVLPIVDDRCDCYAQGVRCPRRRTTKAYCKYHTEPKPLPVPKDQCPICLDDHPKLRWFGCSHGLCSGCLAQVSQYLCPVCRFNIKDNLTAQERRTIKENIRKANGYYDRVQQAQSRRMALDMDAESDEEASVGDEAYDHELSQFARALGGVATTVQPPPPPPVAPRRLGLADVMAHLRGMFPPSAPAQVPQHLRQPRLVDVVHAPPRQQQPSTAVLRSGRVQVNLW